MRLETKPNCIPARQNPRGTRVCRVVCIILLERLRSEVSPNADVLVGGADRNCKCGDSFRLGTRSTSLMRLVWYLERTLHKGQTGAPRQWSLSHKSYPQVGYDTMDTAPLTRSLLSHLALSLRLLFPPHCIPTL